MGIREEEIYKAALIQARRTMEIVKRNLEAGNLGDIDMSINDLELGLRSLDKSHKSATILEARKTPEEKAEEAYQQTLRMQEVNQKLRQLGIWGTSDGINTNFEEPEDGK